MKWFIALVLLVGILAIPVMVAGDQPVAESVECCPFPPPDCPPYCPPRPPDGRN